ncbi:hypothetical protein NADE_003855 [Nannochloris sp. 'desiccata']|nr:hypothetical protein KSW81_004000 [Chlorella desiccata (nom. nud.)]KAH7624503.1 hypothetical protein NADE_003855 [Chlorella desiccata (nom. nud.)]
MPPRLKQSLVQEARAVADAYLKDKKCGVEDFTSIFSEYIMVALVKSGFFQRDFTFVRDRCRPEVRKYSYQVVDATKATDVDVKGYITYRCSGFTSNKHLPPCTAYLRLHVCAETEDQEGPDGNWHSPLYLGLEPCSTEPQQVKRRAAPASSVDTVTDGDSSGSTSAAVSAGTAKKRCTPLKAVSSLPCS